VAIPYTFIVRETVYIQLRDMSPIYLTPYQAETSSYGNDLGLISHKQAKTYKKHNCASNFMQAILYHRAYVLM